MTGRGYPIFCIVNNCTSDQQLDEQRNPLDPPIQLHSFPASMLDKWCAQLKLDRTDLNLRSYVCSEHFSPDMYLDTTHVDNETQKWLKETAYPDVNLPIYSGAKVSKRQVKRNRKMLKQIDTDNQLVIEEMPKKVRGGTRKTKTPRMYTNRCRICLTDEDLDLLNTSLVSAFETLTSFKIVLDQGDHLPRHICSTCQGQMMTAQTFIDRCQRTEHILQVVYQCDDSKLANELLIELNETDVKSEPWEDLEPECDFKDESRLVVESLQITTLDSEDYSNPEMEPSKEDMVEEKKPVVKKTITDQSRKTVLCPSCGKTIAYKTCKAHIEGCSRKPGDVRVRFKCHHCPKQYAEKFVLRQHILKMHFNVELIYKCKYCDAVFYERTQRYIHTCDFHLARLKCHLCPKSYARRFKLNEHIRSVHSLETPFACHLCDKKTSTKTQLRKHVDLVHSTKVLVCDICGKDFKHNKYLQNHRLTHTGVKPYECPVCPQRFIEIRTMRHHCEKRHPEYELPPKGTIFKQDFLLLRQARKELYEKSVKVERAEQKVDQT